MKQFNKLLFIFFIIKFNVSCYPTDYDYLDDPGFTVTYSSDRDQMIRTSNLGVTYQGFRDGISVAKNFYYPDPDNNKIYCSYFKSDASKVDKYLFFENGEFVWSNFRKTSLNSDALTQTVFQTPVDITSDVNGDLWILDETKIRKFSDSASPLLLEIPFLSEVEILQIEYRNSIVALGKLKTTGSHALYFISKDGSWLLDQTLLLPDTQVDSGRKILEVSQFKIINDEYYILYHLEKSYEQENDPYFLERLSADASFQSGIYLYNASGFSEYDIDTTAKGIVIIGRQRNYESDITRLNLELDRIGGFSIQQSATGYFDTLPTWETNKKGMFIQSGDQWLLLNYSGENYLFQLF